MGQVLLLVEQTASTPLFFLHHSVAEFHGAGAVLTGYSNRIFPYVLSQPTELYESYDSRYRSDDYHISLLFHCPAPPFFQYTRNLSAILSKISVNIPWLRFASGLISYQLTDRYQLISFFPQIRYQKLSLSLIHI